MEAMNIKIENDVNLGIQYQTHVQNPGWQDWKSDDQLAGTSGEGLRLEALKVRLTGEDSDKFDVYYRVHCQNFGWMGWAKNGQSSGSSGYGYRLEAIEIKLVPKGNAAPGETMYAYRHPLVEYRTHVQNDGWQDYVSDGAMSGTQGRGLRLEGINIRLKDQDYSGSIQYRTHIQNIGWQDWKSDDVMSGTSGQALRLEAIQIKLTGEMEKNYDVYYQVHAENFGWLGWAKNGESSGTAGYGYRLEGINVVLVPKGSSAPGSTNGAFKSR